MSRFFLGCCLLFSIAYPPTAWGQTWVNQAFTTQTGSFTAAFDTAPTAAAADITIGLSQGPAAAYTDLAAIVRFNATNTIDVRNGGAYTALTQFPYSPNVSYHFRLTVYLATHTYDAYVTAPGGPETLLAQGYSFRIEQAAVTALGNIGVLATLGAAPIQNLAITPLNSATQTLPITVQAPLAVVFNPVNSQIYCNATNQYYSDPAGQTPIGAGTSLVALSITGGNGNPVTYTMTGGAPDFVIAGATIAVGPGGITRTCPFTITVDVEPAQ